MSWVKICKPLIASRWVWLASTLVWSGAALFFATQQWATLRGTAKHMDWSAAFLYQAPSWLLLIPASVILLHVVRRYPIDRSNPTRVVVHGMLTMDDALLMGVLHGLANKQEELEAILDAQPLQVTVLGDGHAGHKLHDEVRASVRNVMASPHRTRRC